MERSIRQERPDVNPERGMGFQPMDDPQCGMGFQPMDDPQCGMGFQPMDDPQTRRPNLAPPSSHVAWASSQ